jgi:hypothetical protein
MRYVQIPYLLGDPMLSGLAFQCFPIGGNQTKVAPATDAHSRLTFRAIMTQKSAVLSVSLSAA